MEGEKKGARKFLLDSKYCFPAPPTRFLNINYFKASLCSIATPDHMGAVHVSGPGCVGPSPVIHWRATCPRVGRSGIAIYSGALRLFYI